MSKNRRHSKFGTHRNRHGYADPEMLKRARNRALRSKARQLMERERYDVLPLKPWGFVDLWP